jgi:glycerol kinase
LENIEARLPEWLACEGDIPLFLNGVGGLGAPYWVAEFDSRLVGDGEPWQKAVALVESIVFLLQTNLELMQKLPPAPARLVVSGGLARYDGLCQRLSDLSGLALYRPAEHEATARGTAYLLAGFPDDWPEEKPGMQFVPKKNAGLRQALTALARGNAARTVETSSSDDRFQYSPQGCSKLSEGPDAFPLCFTAAWRRDHVHGGHELWCRGA